MIDKSVFDTDGKEYEFYLCFFDVREPSAAFSKDLFLRKRENHTVLM